VRRKDGRPRIEHHRLRRRARLEPLPALGILHHPFDELVLVADDERLCTGTARDIIVEQLAG